MREAEKKALKSQTDRQLKLEGQKCKGKRDIRREVEQRELFMYNVYMYVYSQLQSLDREKKQEKVLFWRLLEENYPYNLHA